MKYILTMNFGDFHPRKRKKKKEYEGKYIEGFANFKVGQTSRFRSATSKLVKFTECFLTYFEFLTGANHFNLLQGCISIFKTSVFHSKSAIIVLFMMLRENRP